MYTHPHPRASHAASTKHNQVATGNFKAIGSHNEAHHGNCYLRQAYALWGVLGLIMGTAICGKTMPYGEFWS